jgi:peptide/nickel transport system permease protein
MGRFLLRRLLAVLPTLAAVSFVAFAIIQLPPGDFLDSYIAQLRSQGDAVRESDILELRDRYGLDEPLVVQYWRWISGIVLRGDFGVSFEWNRPVSELLWDRIGYSAALSVAALLVTWIIAFPIGVYSALRPYTVGDYALNVVGLFGIATPSFLVALVLMYIAFSQFGASVGGLFSPEFRDAPWSWARVADLLTHLWIPLLVIATNGTAALIRVLRANLLDELHKPYVVAARARGLSEVHLTAKYPVRIALNPFVSTLGWVLVAIVSGEAIISIVLNLPTTGPLLLQALKAQDMYLAASFILLLSVLTVLGTVISDLLLAWLDPRIRLR